MFGKIESSKKVSLVGTEMKPRKLMTDLEQKIWKPANKSVFEDKIKIQK